MIEFITYFSIAVTVIGILIGIIQLVKGSKKSKESLDQQDKFLDQQTYLPITSLRKRIDSSEIISQLLRKLLASDNQITLREQEISDNSFLMDGYSQTDKNAFIPEGDFLIGYFANLSIQDAIDYIFNSKKESGVNVQGITLIVITPNILTQTEINKIKNREAWKEVKIYDAKKLHEWKESEVLVNLWFDTYIGLNKDGGLRYIDEFWKEWSTGPSIKLNYDLVLGGREKECEQLLEIIVSKKIGAIQSTSKQEALAFIVATLKEHEKDTRQPSLRSVIVDTEYIFQKLISSKNPLIIIPTFSFSNQFNLAINKGHSIIVPLEGENTQTLLNTVALPQVERDKFVNSLIASGLTEENAAKLSLESSRNLTILRRLLKFTGSTPKWSQHEHVRDVLPALLVGGWDSANENDRSILAEVAKMSYTDYSKRLNSWLHVGDSPFIKIGTEWRIASLLDSWSQGSMFLVEADFDILKQTFFEIYSALNPTLDIAADKRHMASLIGKERKHSNELRIGVARSLILVSIYGEKLRFDLPISAEQWVDQIISQLLQNDDLSFWQSIEDNIPLLAEASPRSFLNAIERQINTEHSSLTQLLHEESGGIFNTYAYHTGLLWALESLAWFPEYFSRAVNILATLAANDPGGRLSNRPINSLSEIFKPWHVQTEAPLKDRLEVLERLTETHKDVAQTLLLRLLPAPRGVAFPTHKMKWKHLYSEKQGIKFSEIEETRSKAVDLILSIYDNTEDNFAILIENSDKLNSEDRRKVLSFLATQAESLNEERGSGSKSIRKMLSAHRSSPDARWALPEEVMQEYERVLENLPRAEGIAKHLWLFNEHWPRLPEGGDHRNIEGQARRIKEHRINALQEIYSHDGLTNVIELMKKVHDPLYVGSTLAQLEIQEAEIIKIADLLTESDREKRFAEGYFERKIAKEGFAWFTELFAELEETDSSELMLAILATLVKQSSEIWDFIESRSNDFKDEYWKRLRVNFYECTDEEIKFGLNKLVEYKRLYGSLDVASTNAEKLESNFLISLLNKIADKDSADTPQGNDNLRILWIFDELNKRSDIHREVLANLEWTFLGLLTSYGTARAPQNLENKIATDPAFFVELLSILYKPENADNTYTEERDEQKVHAAYDLLTAWKAIPGVAPDGTINNEQLTSWIEKARDLAVQADRIKVADLHIGSILAEFPEGGEDNNWPPEEIAAIIEKINTDSLKSNFSATVFNKRGFSSRSPFEGGDRERDLAKKFHAMAEKKRNKYPNLATVLEDLAVGYERTAKRIDQEAEKNRLDY